MQQTILALAAILVFSFFALNQHRAEASAERTAVGGEIELAATDLARARLVEATALAFDDALVGNARFDVETNTLTRSRKFGPGQDADEDEETVADDVDDLHGVIANTTVMYDGRPVAFTVAYAVRYVRENAPDTGVGVNQRTLAKEVTVTVQEVTDGTTARPPVTCTLSQVITPAWRMIHG
jgi:hypothetical protein